MARDNIGLQNAINVFCGYVPKRVFKRSIMKLVMSALVSALLMVSAPSFAGSHGGGKMDCMAKENADKAECKKK